MASFKLPERSGSGEISTSEKPSWRSLSAMRQIGSPGQESFKEGNNTFFFKGTNGRWRDVLSNDELAMYEMTKSQVLTPECSRWLEQGRVALS